MKLVLTQNGPVEGVEHKGYSMFLGIPYAKPPVGELRWRAPQPMPKWEKAYQATRFPNRSMQQNIPMGVYDKEFYDEPAYHTAPSEDSLYLNIWTPAEDGTEKLPVAFWIHGGAFMGGYGHEKEFDGAAYCKRGVILVTINYRLGPLGFMAHPWFSEENARAGGPAVSGNYGILDQIAALQWVRDNIEAFGGDRDNITVFGQSAGCMSTQTLVTSPLTKGMIAKAILQSGVGLSYDQPLEVAHTIGKELVQNAGVSSLQELRELSYDSLMRAAGPLIGRGFATNQPPYTPVIDGVVLTEGYDEALQKGHVHDIPYMVGSTRNDIATTPDKVARGDLGKVYAGSREWCVCRRAKGSCKVFLYYFTRDLPGDDAGSFHSSELWYMFGTLGRCWRPMTQADKRLSDEMLDYWANFMKTGEPGGSWNAYETDNDIKIFDV